MHVSHIHQLQNDWNKKWDNHLKHRKTVWLDDYEIDVSIGQQGVYDI